MGLFSNLSKLKEKMPRKTETVSLQKAFTEAMNLLEYLLDEVGWENVSGRNLSYPQKRTVTDVSNWITRNLRKYGEDGYVYRGVNLHTDFVFGRGIDVPKCKNETVQEIISDFWWSSVNQRNFFSFAAQQARHRETLISGEFYALLKIDEETSRVKMYRINPQDILEIIPDEEDQFQPAFYLVRHRKKVWDFKKNEWAQKQLEEKVLHRAIRYKFLEASPEDLKLGLIYHAGLNEFFDILRGSSPIQTVYESADEAKAMADDGATLCHANAEVGWKTKILKGGKNIKDKLVDYFRTKTDGSNPARTAGSEYFENDALNREWITQRDTGATYRKEDMRAHKLYVFAGLGFGEHYMGDASTGNLATATAMELPVLKMIQAEQQWWKSIYSDLIDFVIDLAIMAGKISGILLDADEVEMDTNEDVSYQINFPPIIMKQMDIYMNSLKLGVDNAMIPEKEGARLAMELFEVQEIDEQMKELFDDNQNIKKDKKKSVPEIPNSPDLSLTENQMHRIPGNGNGRRYNRILR